MESFILSGPEDTSGIPHAPLGILFMEFFNAFDENSIAVIDPTSGESLTYAQLCQRSKNLAASLRFLGVTKNENIAVVAENSREFLIVYLAALFLATPLHLINPKYTKYELKHILSLTEPSVVICTKKTRNNMSEILNDLCFLKSLICVDGGSEISLKIDSFRIEDEIDSKDHVALICNSSGTTGLPKAVMLTHENLRLSFIYNRDPEFFGEGIKGNIPAIIPFFHLVGIHLINGVLSAGATIIPMDGFDPVLFLETIQKYKTERLSLVPTLINFLANNPLVDNYDLSSIKTLYCSGSSISKEDVQSVWRRLNLREYHNFYGLTEAGVAVLGSDQSHGNRGRVTYGQQLKVIDLKNGETLSPNNSGEICIKGGIMKGYAKDVEETNKVIDSEGFLHTGDVGHFDQDGYVYVTGRIKEIIKYKSFQVSPNELEMILMRLEGIQDIAVVGKPDRRFGEVPVAFVVKEEGATVTEEEICNYLAGVVNADKRLHGGVRFVQNIPRNSLGKIMRHKLVEQLHDQI